MHDLEHIVGGREIGVIVVRAVIVDPALHSLGGHHFTATERLRGILSALDVEVECWASTDASDEVISELHARPIFSHWIYGRNFESHGEFDTFVASTVSELRRTLRWKFLQPDLFILPSCDQVLALALAKALRFRLGGPPRIVIWLLFAPHPEKLIDDPSLEPLFEEYRVAFKALRDVCKNDKLISVFCETERMASAYRRVIDLPIMVAPGPGVTEPGQVRPLPLKTKMTVTIACLGHATPAKGYGLLPAAVKSVLAHREDVQFKIHAGINKADRFPDFSSLQQMASLGSRVTVVGEPLSSDDYNEWLDYSNFILLPYDAKVYGTRGSGVFTDAAIRGIPTIVTKGCAFAQAAIEDGAAVPIDVHNSDGIARAINLAIEHQAIITKKAGLFAVKQRSRLSAGAIIREALAKF